MLSNQEFLNYLDELYPNAHCELNYTDKFSLLIAVMLSAQTTDVSVNKVTPILFNKFKTIEELASSPIEEIEQTIKQLGLYKNKAKNIKACAQAILERFNGEVPSTMDELTTLPGVGRKTASVVLIEGFKIPAFPVDTHISRVSKRLEFANENDSTEQIDLKLRKRFDQSLWAKLHHQMIFFGRYKCKAIKPECEDCKFKSYCSLK